MKGTNIAFIIGAFVAITMVLLIEAAPSSSEFEVNRRNNSRNETTKDLNGKPCIFRGGDQRVVEDGLCKCEKQRGRLLPRWNCTVTATTTTESSSTSEEASTEEESTEEASTEEASTEEASTEEASTEEASTEETSPEAPTE